MLSTNPESICHWLDTEGSFPPDRAKSVLESMGVQVSRSYGSKILLIEGCNIGIIEIDRHALFPSWSGPVPSVGYYPNYPRDWGWRGHIYDCSRSSYCSIQRSVDKYEFCWYASLLPWEQRWCHVGQAAMMGVMEDIAELTYTHGLATFVSPSHAPDQR